MGASWPPTTGRGMRRRTQIAARPRRDILGPVPELTPDGHHIVVDGRRWRATDPHLSESVRERLVAELMRARRLVRTDAAAARPRVQDAKVALGERGEPWWEEPSGAGLRDRIAATVRALQREDDDVDAAEVAAALRTDADLVTEVAEREGVRLRGA
ncbi:hypothetical protein GCM10027425_28500 [Alteromonas gracilis]